MSKKIVLLQIFFVLDIYYIYLFQNETERVEIFKA